MTRDRWRVLLLLAASVAGGVGLGASGEPPAGPCDATRRGTELLRDGRPARAIGPLGGEGTEPDGCEESALRTYNRALAHARVGRAADDRTEARRHLERAHHGFGAVLRRDSAEDARWNRALVAEWLDRLDRDPAREPGGRPDAPVAGRAAGEGRSDSAGEGRTGAERPTLDGAGRGAARRDVAGGAATGARRKRPPATDPSADPLDPAAVESALREVAASDRRLRALVLRRALVADGQSANRW